MRLADGPTLKKYRWTCCRVLPLPTGCQRSCVHVVNRGLLRGRLMPGACRWDTLHSQDASAGERCNCWGALWRCCVTDCCTVHQAPPAGPTQTALAAQPVGWPNDGRSRGPQRAAAAPARRRFWRRRQSVSQVPVSQVPCQHGVTPVARNSVQQPRCQRMTVGGAKEGGWLATKHAAQGDENVVQMGCMGTSPCIRGR